MAFVRAGVPSLRVPHLQRPILCLRGVYRLEPLVTCVRISAYCEQVDVPVTDPRHLERKDRRKMIDGSSARVGRVFPYENLSLFLFFFANSPAVSFFAFLFGLQGSFRCSAVVQFTCSAGQKQVFP